MQGGMGFVQPKDHSRRRLDEKVERTATEAARRKFSPEFMNRLDKVVVFHTAATRAAPGSARHRTGQCSSASWTRPTDNFCFE